MATGYETLLQLEQAATEGKGLSPQGLQMFSQLQEAYAQGKLSGAPKGPSQPGLGTTAAEVVGGGLGALGGGALGTALLPPGAGTVAGTAFGAGAGTAAGGAAADYLAGRPVRAIPALERFATGGVSEAIGGPIVRKLGEGVGAGVRAVGERFPRLGRAIEAVSPGRVAKPMAREVTEAPAGRALERVHVGTRGQQGLQKALEDWKAGNEFIFRGIENAAGPAPVVPTTELKAFAGDTAEYWARRLDALDPTPEARAAGLDKLGDVLRKAVQSDAISFRDARRLESGLGTLSYSRVPIGTMAQHDAGEVRAGVKRGMDAFLESPPGQQIDPVLDAAKYQYSLQKQLFNRSPVGRLLQADPEHVIDRVFKPGDVTTTIKYRENVPDDVWQDTVRSWAENLYRKYERPGGGFNGTGFAREIQKYIAKDHLKHIITDPVQRAEWEDVASRLGQMGEPGLLNTNVGCRLLSGLGAGLGVGAAGYEYGRSGEDLHFRSHPYLLGGTLGALSLLNPQMRRLYGSLLPQAAGQAGLQYLDRALF